MTLHADPSELRFGSRLPDELRAEAQPCPNLEERTGADLLVSPLRLPTSSDALLRRHTEAGLLIQRKTGSDLAASITDGRLVRSQERMGQWSSQCWLAVVGHLENRSGRGFVDGRETLAYAALQGALAYWQLRGGYLSLLSDDDALVDWVRRWPDRLKAVLENPEKVIVRQPAQELVLDPTLSMLVGVPGVGRERARALLDAATGQARALCLLTNRHGMKVPGIGEGITKSAREWMGLGDSQQLAVVDEDKLADILEVLTEGLDGNLLRYAPLYAYLAEWLGVPCESHKDKGGWVAWAKEVLSEM